MKGSVDVKIRGWIAVLALALVPVAGIAQTPPPTQQPEAAKKSPAPADGKRPVIEIPVTSFAFGDLYHQDQYTHEFVVKNRGNADLVIDDVKPG
jgi:hypothetical protein